MKSEATLGRAREYVIKKREKGVKCPCCRQLVKVYKRQIYSTMVRDLISLYKLCKGNEDYHHISKTTSRGGDLAKFIYWDLVEEMEKDDDTKRTSGYWKITKKGRRFLKGSYSVNKYIHLLDGELVGRSGDMVDVYKCLGSKFDYQKLMGV